jgi:iron complex outermembrane receptor protein
MGTGVGGRGYPADPDIVQEWQEPTGRIIVDWKPDLAFTDDTMIYASLAHGYKGGGANPPTVASPAGYFLRRFQGESVAATFDPEFVDAFEVGTKNTMLGGGLVMNATAFFYDYDGYQVSKIVDRSAANENFDAKVWGAEFEWIFAPTRNIRLNGSFGALRTEIADGERSIDLMDRTQGGHHSSYLDVNGVEHQLAYDEWVVLKPWVTSSSNCVAPLELVEAIVNEGDLLQGLFMLCPPGGITGTDFRPDGSPNSPPNIGIGGTDLPGPPGRRYDPTIEAPNGAAGFFAELGGHELPNAPHWTASLGAQYQFGLGGGWEGTLRGDFYWQSQSFARVYNTQYDKLRAWTNTNLSLWFEQADWGVIAEVYVKNVFDETPITDAFLNSDDSGLTTNVFTLDPRLVGVSVRKSF